MKIKLKQNIKLNIGFLIVIILLITTSCDVTEDSFQLEISETKTTEFIPLDKQEKDKKVYITWEAINKENITYWFDDVIADKKREEIIKNTEIIAKELQKRFSKEVELSYYISPKVYDVVIDGNIYINEENILTDLTKICIQTIYALTDTKSHYGLIYGLSGIVLEELKLKDIELIENENLIEICNKHQTTGILDLTLPMFSKMYATDEQIEQAKEVAISLTKYIIDTRKEYGLLNLISLSSQMTNEFDKFYTEYCNEWIKRLGSEVQLEASLVPLRYSIYGDINYPVAISTQWMTYCFLNGYEEYFKILDFDNSYLKTKELINIFEKEMEKVREFLPIKYSVDNAKGLVCYFNHKLPTSRSSGYRKLECAYLATFIHEYTHNVSLEYRHEYSNTENFMVEGLAEYCTYKFSSYYNIATKNGYNKNNNSKEEYVKNTKKIYDEYMKKNNLEFNTFEFTEVLVIYDLETLGVKAWENDQFSNYNVAVLLTNYLIEQYGIDTYMKVFKDFASFYTYFKESYPNMQKKVLDTLFEKYKPYMK